MSTNTTTPITTDHTLSFFKALVAVVNEANERMPTLSWEAPKALWYENKAYSAILAEGVEIGAIHRSSVTQVEFTDAGIARLIELDQATCPTCSDNSE